MMEPWNIALFLALNASATPDAAILALAKIAAELPVAVAALALVSLWIWGSPKKRAGLLTVLAGLFVALAISTAIDIGWYHPRPFVLRLGHTFVAHSADTSFPSDHATLLWTVGFSLIVNRAARAWGWTLSALGLATAWARIYLGLHFPFDMIGSVVVAAVSAIVTVRVHARVERGLLPRVDHAYETTLAALRLPPLIFPRQDKQ